MSALAASLLEKITSRRARTGVVGLGYVGLPLAVELAKAGFHTTGIDVDVRKVQAIDERRSYIPDVASSDVKTLRDCGTLDATTDFAVVKDLDTINICVPTPLRKTKDPDMSFIVSAVESIASHLHPGLLVCLESTTYPGTTEEVVQPLLEATGLKAGRDFFLAFSPERVDPGNPTFQTHNVPKVVGGLTSGVRGAGECAVRLGHFHDRAGELDACGRDGQAAREHVQGRQHRSGQRAGAHVRPDGHRCLGSRGRGEDEAIRLHGVLSRSRTGRALHSGRSVLPVVESQAERIRRAVHRARGPHQRRHAECTSSTRLARHSTRSARPSTVRRC